MFDIAALPRVDVGLDDLAHPRVAQRTQRPLLAERRQLLVDACQPVTKERFLAFLDAARSVEGARPLFVLKPWTPMGYERSACDIVPVGGRVITVRTGVPDCKARAPASKTEDCEGHEWLELVFDAGGQLIALRASAAG